MEHIMPCGMLMFRTMGESGSKKSFLIIVGLLLLIIVTSCGKQIHPSAASRTSGQSLRAQKLYTNQESPSLLGHHCLPGSTIKISTHEGAVPEFKILKNCYFADREGIRSQNITV